jgi:hypothetical protein
VVGQAQWLQMELAPLLRASAVPVYVMYGNSDFVGTYAATKVALEAPGGSAHVRCLYNEAVRLPGDAGLALVAFTLVPPSNHKLKVRHIAAPPPMRACS